MPQFYNSTPFVFAPVEERAIFGQPSASYVVKATFDIVAGGTVVPAKEQKPVASDTQYMDSLGRSMAWPNDLVPYKPNTDVFIIGAFHQPGGVSAPEGQCAFRFGPLEKTLRIRGPRVASRMAATSGEPPSAWVVSSPEPVAVVPLRWELSRGGLRDPRNPYGLGGDVEAKDGAEILRLPLIEGVATPDVPDNFAPVPPMFQLRRRKLGTRDQRWSLFRAPIPPDDFDPSHVNAAPPDQQAGDSPRGDEAITLINLHPTIPNLTFRLPGLRVRLAVVRKTDAGARGEEVAMRLDTVAMLPEEGKLVLIWRGVVPLAPQSSLDREILAVEIAAEPVGAPPEDPDLPQRLLDRWQTSQAASTARRDAVETLARDEMKKLLPKANLPQEIAALVEGDADPVAIFKAIEKHVGQSIAAIEARLAKL